MTDQTPRTKAGRALERRLDGPQRDYHRYGEAIRAIEAEAAAPLEPSLDAAWARAEAALPKGWHLSGIDSYESDESEHDQNGRHWEANARGQGKSCSCGHADHRLSQYAEGHGGSPSEALDNLSVRLAALAALEDSDD